MAWKRLPLDEDEIAGTRRAFKKRPKFLLDENLGDDAAEWLRSRGHNVKTVRELGKAGASDQARRAVALHTPALLEYATSFGSSPLL